jgi:hypothetical protein
MLFGGLWNSGRRCHDCGSTGECPRCFGTGRNVSLNSDDEKCPNCLGTGVCPSCGEPRITTLGLSGE